MAFHEVDNQSVSELMIQNIKKKNGISIGKCCSHGYDSASNISGI